jgi:hypothetical protein
MPVILGPDGTPAKITSDNRLRTYAGQESEIAFQSRVNGNAYSWTASENVGAEKCLLYLRNNSVDIPLLIHRIYLSCSAAATVEIWTGANKITAAGTAVVGTNLKTDSGKLPDVTCTHTETGADAGGTLSILSTHQIGATTKELINYDGALVLGYLGEVAVNIVTDIVLSSVTILGYFQPIA